MFFRLPRQFWGALACFFLFGMGFGLWGGHIASIEDQIGDSEVAFGSALIGAAIGLIASAPVVGPMSKRFGTAVVIRVSAVFYLLALSGVFWVQNPIQLFAYTLVIGFMGGLIDVAINAQISITERHSKKSLLSRAHGMWNWGGCAGAGSALIFLSFDQRTLHILFGLVFLMVFGAMAMMNLYEKSQENEGENEGENEKILDSAKAASILETKGSNIFKKSTLVKAISANGESHLRFEIALKQRLKAFSFLKEKARRFNGFRGWTNPVLLMMGGVALFGLVLESGMMEWMPIYFADYRGTSMAGSAMVFTFFSGIMGLARMFGDSIRRRFRDKHILIGGALLSGMSLTIGLFIANNIVALCVMSVAGIGIAYVYPLVTSRAAAYRAPGQSHASAAGNIAVVTGIGYVAILISPLIIGIISQFVSFWWGMLAVAGAGPLMAILAMMLPRQKAGR